MLLRLLARKHEKVKCRVSYVCDKEIREKRREKITCHTLSDALWHFVTCWPLHCYTLTTTRPCYIVTTDYYCFHPTDHSPFPGWCYHVMANYFRPQTLSDIAADGFVHNFPATQAESVCCHDHFHLLISVPISAPISPPPLQFMLIKRTHRSEKNRKEWVATVDDRNFIAVNRTKCYCWWLVFYWSHRQTGNGNLLVVWTTCGDNLLHFLLSLSRNSIHEYRTTGIGTDFTKTNTVAH